MGAVASAKLQNIVDDVFDPLGVVDDDAQEARLGRVARFFPQSYNFV